MVLALRTNNSPRGLLVCVALSPSQSVQLELLTALEEEVRATEIRETNETRVEVQVWPSSTRQDLDVNHVKERPIFSQIAGATSIFFPMLTCSSNPR